MLIKVKVHPAASKENLTRKTEDSFEISVKEKPILGMANKRVAEILSLYFKVPVSCVRLIKGFSQRNKIFEVKFGEVEN